MGFYDFEKNLRCIQANYTVRDSSSINVVNSGIDIKSGKLKVTAGYAKANPNEASKLVVSFPMLGGLFTSNGNYW
jgi:lipocalin